MKEETAPSGVQEDNLKEVIGKRVEASRRTLAR